MKWLVRSLVKSPGKEKNQFFHSKQLLLLCVVFGCRNQNSKKSTHAYRMTTKQAFVRRVVGHVTSWTSLCQTHRSDECHLQMWRTSWQRGGWREQYYGAVWEAGVTRDAFKMNTLPSSHWCLLTSSAITLHYAPLWTWTAGVTKSCPSRASRSPSNDKICRPRFKVSTETWKRDAHLENI